MDHINRNARCALTFGLVLQACTTPAQPALQKEQEQSGTAAATVGMDTLTLLDTTRMRQIPIALYPPAVDGPGMCRKLVLISHGYGENKPGTYLHFSSLAGHLAAHGMAVVSIQHELPTDDRLPMKGKLAEVRRPNWERGVVNIHFVLREIQRRYPEWSDAEVALIGHSNGGDMSLLFAEEHPSLVETVISLDNRRMPLPRLREPRICSIRANDAPADPGVLPTLAEQAEFGIRIIQLPNTAHVEMDDRATLPQRTEMNTLVLELLVH